MIDHRYVAFKQLVKASSIAVKILFGFARIFYEKPSLHSPDLSDYYKFSMWIFPSS